MKSVVRSCFGSTVIVMRMYQSCRMSPVLPGNPSGTPSPLAVGAGHTLPPFRSALGRHRTPSVVAYTAYHSDRYTDCGAARQSSMREAGQMLQISCWIWRSSSHSASSGANQTSMQTQRFDRTSDLTQVNIHFVPQKTCTFQPWSQSSAARRGTPHR